MNLKYYFQIYLTLDDFKSIGKFYIINNYISYSFNFHCFYRVLNQNKIVILK